MVSFTNLPNSKLRRARTGSAFFEPLQRISSPVIMQTPGILTGILQGTFCALPYLSASELKRVDAPGLIGKIAATTPGRHLTATAA